MAPVTAYLGLGSNLGDRHSNLKLAAKLLAQAQSRSGQGTGTSSTPANAQVEVLRRSSIYETSPWGLADQPYFLNRVLEVRTALLPKELLAFVKAVERDCGRKPGARYGPRLIDVDILLYRDAVIDLPDLQIPHSQLHLRAFALIPLAELDQSLIHPRLHTTIGDLAAAVDGKEGVKPWAHSR